MNLIETIKAEIERLKELHKTPTFKGDEYEEGGVNGYQLALDKLLSFLDTLEESERPEPYNPVYDEAYLNEKIKKATESWKGVDVDAMLADCRGYDEENSEKPMNQEGLEEELDRFIASGKSVTVEDCGTYKVSYHDFKKVAEHFAEWGYLRAAEKYNEVEYNRQRAEESGSSEIPNDLEEAARHSEILTYPMPEDGDMEKVFKVQEARVFHEIGFIAGAEWAMNRFEPATFGNTLGDTELFKKK